MQLYAADVGHAHTPLVVCQNVHTVCAQCYGTSTRARAARLKHAHARAGETQARTCARRRAAGAAAAQVPAVPRRAVGGRQGEPRLYLGAEPPGAAVWGLRQRPAPEQRGRAAACQRVPQQPPALPDAVRFLPLCVFPACARRQSCAGASGAERARDLSPCANVCMQRTCQPRARAARSPAACTRRAPRTRGGASSEPAYQRRRRGRPARVPPGRDRRQALGALPDVPQRGRQQAGMRALSHTHTATCMGAH